MGGISDPSDDIFAEQFSLFKKYLTDTNPAVLGKVLDTLKLFLSKADQKLIQINQNDIIKVLIEKGVSNKKSNVKDSALECFLMCFEQSEVFVESEETILESINSKLNVVSTPNINLTNRYN